MTVFWLILNTILGGDNGLLKEKDDNLATAHGCIDRCFAHLILSLVEGRSARTDGERLETGSRMGMDLGER